MEKQNFTIEEIARTLEEKYKYYTDEMLQYRTFLGLVNFMRPDVNEAQKVYSICLEGAPGVGKSMFARVYSKLVSDMYGEDVEFIDFTCNKDTGKTELVEEINVLAVVLENGAKVNIPGKIIEAIEKVNQGKKVVLFIDEYDKARRETDSFFNSFLQSGNLNAVQHGDLCVREEYLNNLQVIFCKNNPDVELSEAMQRRLRIIRLDYITPERFYTIAKRNLIDEREEGRKVDEGLLNLVAFIYSKTYENREKLFSRLPATSELIIAIEEADILLRKANAKGSTIYKLLMEDIFKDPDNRDAFIASLKSNSSEEDKKFIKVFNEMQEDKIENEKGKTLKELIGATMFDDLSVLQTEARDKITLAIETIEKYQNLIKGKSSESHLTSDNVTACGKVFNTTNDSDRVLSNFSDETEFLKRGKSVFDGCDNWINIASAVTAGRADNFLFNKLINSAPRCNIVVYENGFKFKNNSGIEVVMTRTYNNGIYEYNIYSSSIIIPPSLLSVIHSAFDIVKQLNKTATVDYSVETLVYNEEELEDLDKTNEDNVYLLQTTDTTVLPTIAKKESISDASAVKVLSDRLLSQGQSRQLTK